MPLRSSRKLLWVGAAAGVLLAGGITAGIAAGYGPCRPGTFKLYTRPGCNSWGPGKCVVGVPPCAERYCGCDGRTHVGCGGSVVPYTQAAACAGEGSALAAVAADSALPAAVEPPPPADAGEAQPGKTATGSAQGGKCPAGLVRAYATPGCGPAATPSCISGGIKPCADSVACSCDGRTQYGCSGLFGSPFRAEGKCRGADGSGGR